MAFLKRSKMVKWSITEASLRASSMTCGMCSHTRSPWQEGPALGLMLCYHHHEIHNFVFELGLWKWSPVEQWSSMWAEDMGLAAVHIHAHRMKPMCRTGSSTLHSWPSLLVRRHMPRAVCDPAESQGGNRAGPEPTLMVAMVTAATGRVVAKATDSTGSSKWTPPWEASLLSTCRH